MKTATSSTKNRPHYWSDAELKKVGIEIRDERCGILLCKKCGSEWSAEPPPAASPVVSRSPWPGSPGRTRPEPPTWGSELVL